MTIKLPTQEQAIEILNRTTGSMAIKALHFDCVVSSGPVTHQVIKRTIRPNLEAISHLLASPVYSDDQFQGASYSLHRKMGLIDRLGGQNGHIAIASRHEANRIFRDKKEFGARTISEFRVAVELIANDYIDEKIEVIESTNVVDGSKDLDVQTIKERLIESFIAIDDIFKQMIAVIDQSNLHGTRINEDLNEPKVESVINHSSEILPTDLTPEKVVRIFELAVEEGCSVPQIPYRIYKEFQMNPSTDILYRTLNGRCHRNVSIPRNLRERYMKMKSSQS